ncbi:MAG: hypothetical protein ACRDPC_18315 [Solirubrobacteraceae bacterium]
MPTNALTRWVAGFIVLILADAAQLLLFFPGRTAELFAWDIQPEVTAMVLASAYVGGGYFFARVLFGAPWERVAAGFPPVILFVWMAAAATFLHLDRFIEENLAFGAWIALYVATPVGVPLLYAYDRRTAGAVEGAPLSRGLRVGLTVPGALVVLVGLAMFAAPGTAIDVWPWTLTPLTARIVAAVVALFGSVWVSVAVDGTVAAARIPLEAHAIGLVTLLVALARGGEGIVVAAAAAAMLAATVAVRLRL